MKIVVWCLVLVGLYFLYQYTLGNIFREYERCYDEAQSDITVANSMGSSSSQCVMKKLAYDEMLQCFTALQKENTMAGIVYDASSVTKNVKEEFTAHNEQCPAHQVEVPSMSIYLKNTSN